MQCNGGGAVERWCCFAEFFLSTTFPLLAWLGNIHLAAYSRLLGYCGSAAAALGLMIMDLCFVFGGCEVIIIACLSGN